MKSISRIQNLCLFQTISNSHPVRKNLTQLNASNRNFGRSANLLGCVEIKPRCEVKPTSTVHAECSGMCMPAFILGTWKMNEIKEAEKALNAAFKVGYRAIDTSTFYGNEMALGCALKAALKENCLKREDVFVITKLPFDAMKCEKVKEYACKSLQRLQTPYIDLYMINFPAGSCKDSCGNYKPDPDVDHASIWKGMEELVNQGKVKYLGVANFNCKQLTTLAQCAKIKPSNVQVEINAYFQDEDFRKVVKENKMTVSGYAPFGRSPAMEEMLKEKGVCSNKKSPLCDACVASIAKKLCKNNGQVLLRFLLQLDDNLAVITGGSDPKIICENFDVFNFKICPEEFDKLKSLDKGKDGRLFDKDVFKILFPGVDKSPHFPWPDC